MTMWMDRLGEAIKFGLRLALLTCVHLLAFVLAAQLTGAADRAPPSVSRDAAEPQLGTVSQTDAGEVDPIAARPANGPNSEQIELLGMIVLVCLLNSTVMITWILRTTLCGSQLVAGSFVVFFTCLTLMPQSETMFFLPDSPGILRQAATMGLVVCALWSVAAVAVLGRWKRPQAERVAVRQSTHSTAGMVWRLVACASVYVALYLVFGYFVAWRNPEVRSLYGGGELRGFLDHIRSPAMAARLIPYQFVRGIVWTVLCLGMMRSSSGGRVSQAIVIGLVLAVVMNAQLLIPNPIMSESVRMVHLVETAASNFLFGVCCVAFWSMGRSSE